MRTDDRGDGAASAEVKVRLHPHAAPFDMTVNLTVSGGTLSSNTVAIAAGETSSASTELRQRRAGAVTIGIEQVAGMPDNFRGLAIGSDATLVLDMSSGGVCGRTRRSAMRSWPQFAEPFTVFTVSRPSIQRLVESS